MFDNKTTSIISGTVPESGAIAEAVVFPDMDAALVPRPLCKFLGVALFRLADGTVWMLNMPGRIWTLGRLSVAADTLSRVSGQALYKDQIVRQLRKALGLNAVMLVEPDLSKVDDRQWGIWETARSLFSRNQKIDSCKSEERSSIEERFRSVEMYLTRELGTALQAFVNGLDVQARALATLDGQIDVACYNYLVHREHQKFRQQFAVSFPSLLSTTVAAVPGSIGAELRTIVDQGQPIIMCLAKRWNVRPGVVRHLVGRPTEQIGTQWVSNIKSLAVLLNVLRPEDLPGDNADEWKNFNYIVATGQSLFRKPIWKSEITLMWLADCVYHTKRGTQKTSSRWLPDRNGIARISRFRDILVQNLRRDTSSQVADVVGLQQDMIDNTVDWFIFMHAHKGLDELALGFEENVDRLKAEDVHITKVAHGDAMLPLIPADFISSDCTRVIRPLTTHSQLRLHGVKQKNCLSQGYIYHYLRKGSGGYAFIIGVFKYGTGKPCSTAEILVKHQPHSIAYDLVVNQHMAENNDAPDDSCTRAVRELMTFCRTPEVRCHLEHAWHYLHYRKWSTRRVVKPEINPTMTKALKRTLGESVYEDLLARVLSGVTQ